jgi:DNA-binding CsgD family transcriptional regulator
LVDFSQKPYFHYGDILNLLMNSIQSQADVRFHSLIRIFSNGERFLVSNNKEESVGYMENRLYRYGVYEKNRKTNHRNVSSCFRMWDYLLYSPPEIFQYRSQKFNMAHGLTIIQQHGRYCDFFGFSTRPGNNQINNFYLDQKELFTKFVEDFYVEMRDKLTDLSNHTFRLPEGTQFVEHYLLTLSPRQQECAKLLAEGFNTKEIAQQLYLSPRTVETHIDILKDKFKARNRVQLMGMLNKLL